MLDAAGVNGIELVGLDEVPPFPEAPETGATFEENALAKARDGAAATGMPAKPSRQTPMRRRFGTSLPCAASSIKAR